MTPNPQAKAVYMARRAQVLKLRTEALAQVTLLAVGESVDIRLENRNQWEHVRSDASYRKTFALKRIGGGFRVTRMV